MKLLLILAVLVSFSWALFNPINNEIVEEIKNKATTWTPKEVESNPLAKRDSFELLSLLGSRQVQADPSRQLTHVINDDIPKSFSALNQWSDCMLPIMDQQLCGADWAFIAVEILSERMCISTNATQKVMLSINDVLSCDEKDWGCSGGYPDRAWDYMTDDGVLTAECFPFQSADGHRVQCPFQEKCIAGEDIEYKKYHSKPFNLFTGEQTIQKELMTNGPLQTEFQVYSDFLNYGSGVYQHATGGKLGFYSAKIVGWGVAEGETPYWLAATVLGEEWGEKGYFRIKRGSNECNFENSALAGDIDTTRM